MSLFLRLLEADDKAAALREAVQAVRGDQPDRRVFDIDPEGFRQVPGSPFAYWVSSTCLDLFVHYAHFGSGRVAQRALSTNDDFRYLRL